MTDTWSAPWCDPGVPELQGHQAAIDFENWKAGAPHGAFDLFKDVVQAIPIAHIPEDNQAFLEIGSGTGYGSAVLKHLRPTWDYTGLEISRAMIDYATQHWPAKYIQGDMNELPCADGSFDVVMLAGVIQHAADWRRVVDEAARVSSRWVIPHRLHATTHATNESVNVAYGVAHSIRENCESEFLSYCESVGLTLVHPVRRGLPIAFQASYLMEKR